MNVEEQFWEQTGKDFRSIIDPFESLSATSRHDSDSSRGKWNLMGADSNHRLRFELYARRAAKALWPDEPDGLAAWLDVLRDKSSHFRLFGTGNETFDDGTPGPTFVLGEIQGVCRASAEYCTEIQIALLKRKPSEKVSEAPPASSGNAMPTDDATEQRKLVDYYIAEVYRKTGNRISRTDIWRKTHYTDETEFERWQKGKRQRGSKPDKTFRQLLTVDKPHLNVDVH